MDTLKNINFTIALVFSVLYLYQLIYIAVPFIKRDKPHKPTVLHRYAVLISARNEEAVIAKLIESIKNQNYPQELVTIFVVADNCTDSTAKVARNAGAVVFERFDNQRIGKGYALDYLIRKIHESYSPDAFDGYFVFDADNVLDENYIAEMNRTFSDGYKIITSYRNSKNYGDNWISAGYSLLFLRESKYLNHARMLLNTSCSVSGTGYLFSREILEKTGGWKFFLLTEDIEFTMYHVIHGEKIGYCSTAVIYDEQPVKFSQSWKQRMRWSRGYLQVFRKYGPELLKGILRGDFSCFDMCMAMMPAIVLTILGIIINLSVIIAGFCSGDNMKIVLGPVLKAMFYAYLMFASMGAVTTISEWSKIYTTAFKKILYIFTFPLFMVTYIPISMAALFTKVEWQPMEHNKAMSLREIRGADRKLLKRAIG